MQNTLKSTFNLSSPIVSLILLCLVACGAPKKALISQAEINAAEANGSLNILYQKASGLVNANTGSVKKDAALLQSRIADLLVKQNSELLEAVLTNHSNNINNVTRQSLLETKQKISGMKQWSAVDYARLQPKLEQALTQTNTLINSYIAQSKNKANNLIEMLSWLKKAAQLAGTNQAESANYKESYDAALAQYLYQGNDGLSKRLYNSVISSAEMGLKLDPGNIQFESMLSQGQAGLFEKDFRFALENGKPESAYLSLLKVADKTIFLQLKKSMGKSILFLANYFSSSAKFSYNKGDLIGAYQHFKRGRKVQETLSIAQKGFIQEKNFLDLVNLRVKDESLGDGKRQALLRVINEFDPNYPGLKAEYLKLSEKVKNRALTKISVVEFKEVIGADSIMASVGRRIGSKLEKILFDRLGNEVLVVTNIESASEKGFAGLALKIDGEVLQAAIEHSSNQGKRTKKVQTGINRVETEEYKAWSARKRGDPPKQFHENVIKEDVVLTIEHIRKQSIAEVAYRIIEPSTGKILLTDSFVKESEFSGESINEYQKGDFHQQYIRADLPSDIKIIDNLATELASQLGDKLAAYLQNPEQVFYQKYLDAKAQADNQSAVELLANALIIAENKASQIETSQIWYDELKLMILQ